MGDFNAISQAFEVIVGKYGLRIRNETGETLIQVCKKIKYTFMRLSLNCHPVDFTLGSHQLTMYTVWPDIELTIIKHKVLKCCWTS